MEKFNVGDKVRRISGSHQGMKEGDEGVIVKIEDTQLFIKGFGDSHHIDNIELVSRTDNPKAFEKYMVYGIGCDNKSNLYISEKEMSKKARALAEDDSWSGDIIGYKLIPIFKVEKKTVLSKFKKTAKKKAKK